MYGDTRTHSTGYAGLRLALVLAICAATPLGAQDPDHAFRQVPQIRGAQPDPEAEAARLAILGSEARVKAVRVGASMERIVRSYQQSLRSTNGPPSDSVRPSELGPTMVTHRIRYHAFDRDECTDPAGASDAATCRRWRKGKDKEKTLIRSRATDETGLFVETATFTWYAREPSGQLARMRVEIRDMGVSSNWKRHIPLVLITMENIPVPEPTPAAEVDSADGPAREEAGGA